MFGFLTWGDRLRTGVLLQAVGWDSPNEAERMKPTLPMPGWAKRQRTKAMRLLRNSPFSLHTLNRSSLYSLASSTMVRTVQLSDGTSMPAMAWGNMGGNEKALAAGTVALKCGIHHIDTAQIYRTEGQVLDAIKGASLQRDEVYVTTKRMSGAPSEWRAKLTGSLQYAR